MASAWAGVNSASVSGRATACVSSIASPIIARTRGRRVDRGPDPRFPEGDSGRRRRGRDARHYRGDPSTGVGADGWAEMERGPSAPSVPLTAEVIRQSAVVGSEADDARRRTSPPGERRSLDPAFGLGFSRGRTARLPRVAHDSQHGVSMVRRDAGGGDGAGTGPAAADRPAGATAGGVLLGSGRAGNRLGVLQRLGPAR